MIEWTLALLALTYGFAAFTLDRYGRRAPRGHFDAIVVAGCRVMPDGLPSTDLARRIDRAVEHYHQGLADTLVFTGGVGAASVSEAEASAQHAERQGVPREAMVLEARSTSTEENARFAAELVGREARILVVSSAYHVFRCERVFGRHFSSVRGSGSVGNLGPRLKGALREVTALSAYAILGRL